MKNLLFALSLFLFLLVSCNGSNISEEIISPSNSDIPIESEVIESNPLNLYVYYTSQEYLYDKYDRWSEYIKAEYNIDLKVNSYLLETVDTLLGGDLNGIYALDVYDYLTLENTKNYFKPFNDLETVSLLDDGLVKNHYINGELLTLPYDYKDVNFKVRKYNIDLLPDNYEVPKSLNELYESLLFVKTRTEGKEIYMMEKLDDKNVFKPYNDILQSFAINIDLNSVVYNEDNNSFYDVMLTENMHDCIEYLKFLMQYELIPKNYPSDFSYKNGNVFSEYATLGSSLGNTYSTYLLNDKYDYSCTIAYNPTRTVYLLGKNTKIDGNINNFINQVYNNRMANIALRYGIPNEDYDFNNDVITGMDINKIPNAVGAFSKNYKVAYEGLDNEEYYRVKNDVMESGVVKTLSIYSLLPYAEFNSYRNKLGSFIFSQEYNKQVYDYLSAGDISYEDFINQYVIIAKSKNAEKEINRLNEMIGSNIVFTY